MKRMIAAGAVLGGLFAVTVPAEPVGACSIYCAGGEISLELVEVRLVSSATAPEADEIPEWPELATMDGWGSMWFPEADGYLYLAPVEE